MLIALSVRSPYDTHLILGLIVTLLLVTFSVNNMRGHLLKSYCVPDTCGMFLTCVIYDP